ncbi:MAG: hypothetical protein ACHP9T_05555 [Caulobacterales bacterium]|jgi:hypothetical protein
MPPARPEFVAPKPVGLGRPAAVDAIPAPTVAAPAVAGAPRPPLTPGLAGVDPLALAGGETAAVCAMSPAAPPPAPVVAAPMAPLPEGAVAGPALAPPTPGRPGVMVKVVVVVVSPFFEQPAMSRLEAASTAPQASKVTRRDCWVISDLL